MKLDVAFGELRHPEDWPTDDDLAEREPSQPDDLQETAPVPLAADGGQVKTLSKGNDDGGTVSADRHSDPDGSLDTPTAIDEAPLGPDLDPDLDTACGICYRISERIRGLNHEIDCRRAELRDLKTALAIFEELGEKSGPETDTPER